MSYVAADVAGITESSLTIYRYDGWPWHALDSCSVDPTVRTVSCTTATFSTFMIFGTPTPVVAGSGGSVILFSQPISYSPKATAGEMAGSIKTAEKIVATLDQMLNEAKQIINLKAETRVVDFIAYGTDTTKILGSGERAGIVNSYESAYGRLPKFETDWSDIIKLANGRWPSQTNKAAEERAIINFRKVYLRNPGVVDSNAHTAIIMMAYGLRPAKRNFDSEKIAIRIFRAIYGYTPSTTMAWDVVRAIAYSGAKR
jgi:hypothetical protein